MEHSRNVVRTIMSYGYDEQEAINILDGKNPDGTEFIELPF